MNSKHNVVFDSSALLTLLYQEKGASTVEDVLDGAVMNTINASEVTSVLARDGLEEAAIRESIFDLKMKIIPVDNSVVLRTGTLITKTKQFGLSLGDRACLAFAESLKLPVYTTDKQWAQVQKFLSVPIKFVR